MKKLYLLFIVSSLIGFSQNPGDIVITEIMKDPSVAVDTAGEWFEVYNTTSADIDINGWTLKDDGNNNYIIDSTFNPTTGTGGVTIVPAGGYLVLGKTLDMTINGGTPIDFAYQTNFNMGNGSDEIVLLAPGNIEISRVNYDGGPDFPDLNGISMQLNTAFLNETDNDDGDNWCASISSYGDGDIGTPGITNEACAPECTIVFGTFDATCNSINSGSTDDTYTISLPYSGGNVGTTFIVSSTAGMVTGDNPSTAESGTITVTNIPENTDITITLDDTADGGLCSTTFNITSPICIPVGSIDLELIGVLDLTVPSGGNDGKAIHLVATADIADLSVYGIGVAANGDGTDGQEYTFDAISVSNGSHILLARTPSSMEQYLTTDGYNLFDVVLTATQSINMNGDDAVELFKNGTLIETFGDADVDGTGENWEYEDSWAYKNSIGSSWPSGWSYGTVNCTNGSQTTYSSTCVYPFVESLSTILFTERELSIYPNPTNADFVTIISPSSDVINVNIFDILGKQIKSEIITDSTLNVSHLNTGVYILKITQNNTYTTKRLVIK
ncbi:lamin tail domain-containing protein [uncultured Winogradskyella sp.]|uniref:lamin tail domain-containing protein n=1 Tax=uncultured Winogradskyella sp. TaxID=395353 RepID=UPI002604E00F|nr:lamin tail domain-containing protein [uncultured Winogradskyella sp.]